MEDSGSSPVRLTDSLSEWTLVNSQGELMQGEGDSDSSESSIEVVSVEGNDIVSFHHGKTEKPESPEPDQNHDNENDNTHSAEGNISESSTSSQNEQAGRITNTDDEASGMRSISVGGENMLEEDSDILPQTTMMLAEGVENPVPNSQADSAKDLNQSVSQTVLEQEQPQQKDAEQEMLPKKSAIMQELSGGACCMELLSESESKPNIPDDVEKYTDIGSCSDTGERDDLSGVVVSSKAGSSRGDSDTDSDFVQLDAEHVEDLEAHIAANQDEEEEEEVLPLRRFSSIDENFNFMRGQEIRAPNPPFLPAVNNVDNENDESFDDNDRDDETESFTEEGVDDRIESEQSDSGSALNDVGDLSAFADIGDIPLVTGDVPRNYIHQPNNHLSTVLNATLVLAAILTMGISLGIIMATDLEIEEWQNAYELQTIRVKQLELQLLEKKSLLDAQSSKVTQMEGRTKQLRASLTDASVQTLKYRKTEKALHWLEAHGIVEGGQFAQVAHLVRGVIHVFIHCGEDYDGFMGIGKGDDNSSVLTAGPCGDQLSNYMDKIKSLAAVGDLDEEKKDAASDGVAVKQESSLNEAVVVEDGKGQGQDFEVMDAPQKSGAEESETEKDPGHVEGIKRNKGIQTSDSQKVESISRETKEQSKVDLDIRHLQQSLSREQERALHWQSLYLFERRQKERERENEEWEDERDRVQWEEWEREREESQRARPELDELDCLKRVLASNLSTLTQHVAKWNVSLFDDFANLSVLLSTVHDLKQSVMDSVHKVWEGAGEAFENMQWEGNKDGTGSKANSERSFSYKEEIVQQVKKIIQAVQNNSKPQIKALLLNLHGKLERMKQGLGNLGKEVNASMVADQVRQAWNVTGETLGKLQKDVSEALPDREALLAPIKNLLHSFEVKYREEKPYAPEENTSVPNQEDDESSEEAFVPKEKRLNKNMEDHDGNNDHDIDNDHDDYDEDDDEDDEDDDDDEVNGKDARRKFNKDSQGSWSRGLNNIISVTHKSFRKLGKKVSRTFVEMKNIWHKKNKPLFRIAKHLTSKFMRASIKLSKLPATLFKGSSDDKEGNQMQIYSKHVKKLRKQWQKQLLKDPCQAAGELSPECNADKKALKQDLKEVSKLFSMLLKVKTFQTEDALRLSHEDASLHFGLFKSFLERWGGRHLLLKKDIEWAVCQRDWWSEVLHALSVPNGKHNIDDNTCDVLGAWASFFPGGDMDKINEGKESKKKKEKRYEDDEEEDEGNYSQGEPVYSKHEPLPDVQTSKNETDSSESEAIENAEPDQDWYTMRARYRLHHRREKEKRIANHHKQRHHRHSLKHQKEQKLEHENHEGGKSSDWYLRKAEDREYQREEQRKSDWVFERARLHKHGAGKWHHRRRAHHNHDDHYHGKKCQDCEENWTLKHGHHRQQQRDEDHRADWFFHRAADRKDHHHWARRHCSGGKFSKNHRCVYGTASVSSP